MFNWVVDRLTAGLKKRVLKFILKKAVGRFIRDVDLSQLDIQLYQGVIELNDLQLNLDGLNRQLQETSLPLELINGYIEKITIQVPWNDLLNQNMDIVIHGIEMQFRVKEKEASLDNDTSHFMSGSGAWSQSGMASSLMQSTWNVSSSFFAGNDRRDPNVLATSMLIGDVKKGEVESEIHDSDDENESSSKKANDVTSLGFEGEENIAQLIERILTNIKASVKLATVRLEFPSATTDGDTVVVLHFPKLDYADETQMPRDGQSWSPSLFIYKFMFGGFIMQMFKNSAATSPPSHDTSGTSVPTSPVSLASSTFSMNSSRLGQSIYALSESVLNNIGMSSNNGDFMDEGHNVLFGDTEGNQIEIRFRPESDELQHGLHSYGGNENTNGKSSIEIEFDISSLHAVIKPSQIHNILEILETVKKAFIGENTGHATNNNHETTHNRDKYEIPNTHLQAPSQQKRWQQQQQQQQQEQQQEQQQYEQDQFKPMQQSDTVYFKDEELQAKPIPLYFDSDDDESDDDKRMHQAEAFRPMRGDAYFVSESRKMEGNVNSRAAPTLDSTMARRKFKSPSRNTPTHDQYFNSVPLQQSYHSNFEELARHMDIMTDMDNDIDDDDHYTDASLPTSLHFALNLKAATCSVVYEDCDLRGMWERFMTDNINREKGPLIPMADHLWMSWEDVTVRSENNSKNNSLRIAMGNLTVLEKLLKENAMKFSGDKNLSQDMYDLLLRTNIPSKQHIENVVEFNSPGMRRKTDTTEPHPTRGMQLNESFQDSEESISLTTILYRQDNTTDTRLHLKPVEVNVNTGLIDRLCQIAGTILKRRHQQQQQYRQQQSFQYPNDANMPTIEVTAPDDHNQSFRVKFAPDSQEFESQSLQTNSTHGADIELIRIVVSLPRALEHKENPKDKLTLCRSKIDMQEERISLLIHDLCISSSGHEQSQSSQWTRNFDSTRSTLQKSNNSLQQISWSGNIGKVALHLEKNRSKQQDRWKAIGLEELDFTLFGQGKQPSETVSSPSHDRYAYYDDISSSASDIYSDSSDESTSASIPEPSMGHHRQSDRGRIANDDSDSSDGSDMFQSDETLERNINEQKYLQRAKDAVVLSCKRASLAFSDKSQLYRMLNIVQNELLTDVSESLQRLTTNETQESTSSSKRRKSSEKGKKNDNDLNLAVQISVDTAQITLHDMFTPAAPDDPLGKLPPTRHTYRICLQDLNLFYMARYNGMMKIHMRDENISLYEIMNSGQEVPILTSCNKLIKPYRKIKSAMLMNLTITEKKLGGLSSPTSPSSPGNSSKETQMTMSLAKKIMKLQLNGLYLRHYVTLPQDSWISCLLDALQPPPSREHNPLHENASTMPLPDEPIQDSNTSLHIMLQDCAVDYAPKIEKQPAKSRALETPSRLVAIIDQTIVSSQLAASAYETSFKIELNGLSAMMHNNISRDEDLVRLLTREVNNDRDGGDDGVTQPSISEFGFINELKKKQFVTVASLDRLHIDVTTIAGNKGTGTTKESPCIQIDCTQGTAALHGCSDSFMTLIHTVTHLSNSVDVSDLIEKRQHRRQEEMMARGHSEDVQYGCMKSADLISQAIASPMVASGLTALSEATEQSIMSPDTMVVVQDYYGEASQTSSTNQKLDHQTSAIPGFLGLGAYINDDHFDSVDAQEGIYPTLSAEDTQDTTSNIDDDRVDVHLSAQSSNSQPRTIDTLRKTTAKRITVTPTNLDKDDTITLYCPSPAKDDDYFTTQSSDEKSPIRELLGSEYPQPEIGFAIGDNFNVQCFLYAGLDWPTLSNSSASSDAPVSSDTSDSPVSPDEPASSGTSTRDMTQILEVQLKDLRVQFDSFSVFDEFSWRMRCRIRDIEVSDKIMLSTRNILFKYWNPDEGHFPREEGSMMLDLLWESIRINTDLPDNQEQRVSVDVLPMRFNIHQQAFNFLRTFFHITYEDLYAKPDQTETPRKDIRQVVLNAFRKLIRYLYDANDNKDKETTTTLALPFYQKFEVSELRMKIDYEPVRFDHSKLYGGDTMEALNVTAISDLELQFDRIELTGINGNDSLSEKLVERLLGQLTISQKLSLLLGILPIRSLYNVGGGIYDLVMLPVGQYQNNGFVSRGVQRGVQSFFSNLAVETVNLSAQVSDSASSTLSWVRGLFANDEQSESAGQGSSQDQPMYRQRASSRSVPTNAVDGLGQGFSSVTQGFNDAAVAVVAIPRQGISHAPIAVLSPFIGATEAISKVLQGVRNQVDPSHRSEHESLYK